MANGREKQNRIESLQLVCIAFHESLDVPKFLSTGQIDESNIGKTFELPPEKDEQLQAEIQKLRDANPNLPKYKAGS